MGNIQTALISGASSGIGEQFARVLHSRGYQVVIVARREDKLKEICEQLNSQRADSATYKVCDLSLASERQDLCAWIKQQDIEVLVLNAGFGSFGEFESLDLVREQQMVSLNVLAVQELSSAAIPKLKAKRSGGIIILASVAGHIPVPYMASYCATKAFDHFFAQALHYELKPFGVTVTSVCPGPVDTEFSGVARVSFGSSPRVDARVVAEQSIEAFLEGKRQVFPHWSAKLIRYISMVVPESVSLMIAAWMMKKTLKEAQKK